MTARTKRLAAALKDRDVTIKQAEVVLWTGGEPNRWPVVKRPCPCGCDERVHKVVGYLTASDKDGNGITIYAPDEATYQRLAALFPEVIG